MKKTLSTILATSMALSLLAMPISATELAETQQLPKEITANQGESREIQQETLGITDYQAGYFHYEEIISPQYQDGGRFSEDERLVAVKKDGKWGFINEYNQAVVPFLYDYAGDFSEGHAIVGAGNSSGYTLGMVDTQGNYKAITHKDSGAPVVVTSSGMEGNTFFHNGLCVGFSTGSGSSYTGLIIDKTGTATSVPGYVLNPYNEGVITANTSTNGKSVVLDANGSLIYALEGAYHCYGMNQGLIPAQNSAGDWGFWNYNSGTWQISPQYSFVIWSYINSTCVVFDEVGQAAVQKNGKLGTIDMYNNTIIPFNYDWLFTSVEGMRKYVNNSKHGFLNTAGEVVFSNTYTNATSFNEGMAAVKSGSSTYIIDQKGNKIDASESLDGSIYFTETMIISPSELVNITKNGLTGFAQVTFNPEFPVQGDTSDWALDAVIEAIRAKLVPAGKQNMYTNPVTRSDFAELVLLAMATRQGQTVEQYVQSKTGKTLTQLQNTYPFNDTNSQYVVAAAALGVVSGKGDNRFDPYSEITREEVAVILHAMSRVSGDDMGNPVATDFGDGWSISSWAQSGVDFVVSKGIMSGVGDNNFNPKGICTREQTYIIMLNYYKNL